jgi:flavin reductase (DIM6/NTAB) family NADH-FMN oxidoreductase RutF
VGHANKPFSLRVPSLVLSRNKTGRLNLMAATWFTPVGFTPSSVVLAVEKKALTYDFIEEVGEFVLVAPTQAMAEAVVLCGTVSGHHEDKWARLGLTAVSPFKGTIPLIAEAAGHVECRVRQRFELDEEMVLYHGETLESSVRLGNLEGDIYTPKSDVLLWLGSKYDKSGKRLGRFAGRLGAVHQIDPT